MTSIRDENPADKRAVHDVHAASFPTESEARLVDAMRAAGQLRVSLVAVDQNEVVGHVAFSPVHVTGATDGVGLAPVAVLHDYRRRGIADRLIREGLVMCRRASHGFVVVLGDPGYYGRFGFKPASEWALHDEYGGGDAFQALEAATRLDSNRRTNGRLRSAVRHGDRIRSRMRTYHHLGIPTTEKRPGEIHHAHLKLFVSGFGQSPYNIEWIRYEDDAPYPDLVKTVPHVAFEVDDLERELRGKHVIIEPNSPSPGVVVAFIEENGAPVEFLQLDLTSPTDGERARRRHRLPRRISSTR